MILICMQKNIKEYEHMVLNFEKYEINYNENSIKEFYLMHNIIRKSDWLLDDVNEIIGKIGYQNFYKLKFYEEFIENFDNAKGTRIKELLSSFLKNEREYYLKNRSFILDTHQDLSYIQM